MTQGDGESQAKSDGPRDPATSMDTETEAEVRGREAEVEPGGRWIEAAKVGAGRRG